MSFFDSVPEQPPPLPAESGRAAWMRPDAVIPGSTAVDLPLIRTDEVAVAVSSVRAYPNGFEFTVHVRLRQDQLVWGAAPLDWVADLRTRQAPERALRLGSCTPMAAGPRPGGAPTMERPRAIAV
jgi:hypothetical protein